MIITQKIEIRLNSKTIKHYIDLGYTGKPNETIIINVKDLVKTSHYKIDCICENCKTTKNIFYRNYIKNVSKYGIYYCISCCDLKKTITCKQRYGVDHISKVDTVIKKKKKTCKKRYGTEYYFCSKEFLDNEEIKNKIKVTKELAGLNISDDELTPFLLYKKECRNLTKKIKPKLYETWDGYDYYDGKYIKNNLQLHHTNKNYPTIDHKLSIFYGFKNNISPEIICDISNLCITKRKINSSKREKTNSDI